MQSPQGEMDKRLVQVARLLMLTREEVEKLNAVVNAFKERAPQAPHGTPGPGGDLATRIDRLQQDVDRALAGMNGIVERVDVASSRLDEQVFALKHRVAAFADGIEQWFNPAKDDIQANREYVKRAAEQVKQQVDQFHETARVLELRLDGGLADLQQRHNALDEVVKTLATTLEHKLGDFLHELAQNPDRTGDIVLGHVKPHVERIADHVSETERTLVEQMRQTQEQIAAALGRNEERIAPVLADFAERLKNTEKSNAEVRDTTRALQQQLGGAVGRMEDGVTSIRQTLEGIVGATFERKLAEITETIESATTRMAEQLDERVAKTLEALDERSRRDDEDDADKRAEMVNGQKELGMAILRLQGRLADGLSELKRSLAGPREAGEGGGAAAADIADDLNDLRERILGLQDQLSLAVEDRGRAEGGGELKAQLGDLREQIEALGSRFEGVPAEVARQLDVATVEIDKRVSEALAGVRSIAQSNGGGGDADPQQLAALDQQLGDLREHLSALGGQIEGLGGRLDERVSAAPAGGTPVSLDADVQMRLEEQVNELRDRLVKISDKLDHKLEPLMTALKELGSGPDKDRLEQQLSAVKAAIDAVPGAISARIAEAMPAGGSGGGGAALDPGAFADIERRLGDLRDHLVGLGSQLSGVPSEIDQRISQAMASVSFGLMPAESAEHLSGLLNRVEQRVSKALDDLTTRQGPDPKQLADLQRNLAAVGEQVTTVLERGLQTDDGQPAPDIDALLARAMADVQSKLEDVTRHLDERLAETLSGLEARVSAAPASGSGGGAAHAPALVEKLDHLQEKFNSSTEQMDRRLADVLEALETTRANLAAAPQRAPAPAPASTPGKPGPAAGGAKPAAAQPPAGLHKAPFKPRGAEELVNLLVDAINSDDDRAIRKFVSNEYADSALAEGSIDDRVEVYKSVYDETGEQRVVSVEESEKTVTAITQSRTSLSRLRFEIIRDPSAPHKILVVNIDDA